MTHPRDVYECARDAMSRSELDTADRLAVTVMKTFPYSKYAALSEELRADLLAARHEYADADAAYDRFLKLHPTSDRADEIRRKQADVRGRAKP